MRILLVNYEYPPIGAGAATATRAIARALVRAGHHVVVLTGRYKGLAANSSEDGITIRRIPGLRRAMDRSGILEMASFLAVGLMVAPGIMKRHQIAATIVFFSLPSGPIGLLGRWRCAVPYVVSLRGGDVPGAEPSLSLIHWILTPLRRAVLKNSVGVIANSEGLKKMAEAADPFPVEVILNGVDAEFFVPLESRSAHDVLRILFVGRFQKQKNLPFLMQQVARLPAGTFELHLVGDGPEKDRLRRLAAQLGITSAITWSGWLPRADLRAIYQSCDCLVNPSTYEGMPNVVLEAMAAGLPVIASNVPGNDALVKPGETGFLFELGDKESLRSALDALRDPTNRTRMGVAAAARARQLPTWEDVARRYVELFRASREAMGK
jgi:glycosyltransferase involved in cell wall biosynthesis